MSRRAVNPSRRLIDGGGVPLVGSLHQKSRASPLLSVGLIVLGALLLIAYSYSGSGGFAAKESLSTNGAVSCTSEIQQAVPVLKKAYGDGMRKVLHVGPETCTVLSKLLKEEEMEAWGVEPYDLEEADSGCKSLVHKGIVRAADIKFPLPYRPNSFSLVIVSDALDYLSPKYLNKTLLDLARVSMDGLVIFTGYPGQQRAKVTELSKFGRPVKLLHTWSPTSNNVTKTCATCQSGEKSWKRGCRCHRTVGAKCRAKVHERGCRALQNKRLVPEWREKLWSLVEPGEKPVMRLTVKLLQRLYEADERGCSW